MPGRMLMVVSAATSLTARDGSSLPTGFWASEVVEPFETLRAAGYDVVVATPGGREPTPDERSLDDDVRARLDGIPGLRAPEAPPQIEDVSGFSAVVLPGGHGPMADLYADAQLGRILRAAVNADVPVLAICHGPAGLLSALQGDDAAWPFAGRTMTAFSDAEEAAAGLADRLPWSLERQLTENGAKLEFADEPYGVKVVVDGRLVTGQNPASAKPATDALVDLLAGG